LPDVAVGEFPQMDPQRRRRIDEVEHLFHSAGPHHLQVVDAVGAGGQSGDDRRQLPGRVRPAGADPFVGEPDVIIE